MKSIKYILIFTFTALLIVACKNNQEPEVKTVDVEHNTEKNLDPNAHYAKAEFNIEGMTCAMGCAKTIEKKLSGMDGVKMAKVDFDKQLAMVEYDDATVTPNSLTEAVKSVGDAYTVENMKTVDAFSDAKACKPGCKKTCDKDAKDKMACKPDCDKPCCANKTEAEKKEMACTKDCKKACCSEKKA